MSQTELNRNQLFYSVKGEPARTKTLTVISGSGELVAGTVLVPGTGGVEPPADKAAVNGWVVLLEDVDATSSAVDALCGITGGVDEEDLVFAGTLAAYDDDVRQKFQMNGIYVQKSTDSIRVAGE